MGPAVAIGAITAAVAGSDVGSSNSGAREEDPKRGNSAEARSLVRTHQYRAFILASHFTIAFLCFFSARLPRPCGAAATALPPFARGFFVQRALWVGLLLPPTLPPLALMVVARLDG